MKPSWMNLSVVLTSLFLVTPALAQDPTPTTPEEPQAPEAGAPQAEDSEASEVAQEEDDSQEDEDAQPAEDPAQPAEAPEQPAAVVTPTPEPTPEAPPAPEAQPAPVVAPAPTAGTSPIADLGSDEMQPLEDIEEETLSPILSSTVHPYVTWDGLFRVRSALAVGFDLDTRGTSAILPPADSYAPVGNPADPASDTLWSTNMNLRLEPTLFITEGINVHMELGLLNNLVLGSLPVYELGRNPLTPDPSRSVGSNNQQSPLERAWFNGPLQIQEAYGEIDGFFGVLRAGRMDNHWGLGMFFNDGDCLECNFGDHMDRVMLQTKAFGFYGTLAVDFPGDGATSIHPSMPYGQPYDLTQTDDVDQYTVSVSYAPKTLEEKQLQQKRLVEDRKPVFNGGLLFSLRDQEGLFATTGQFLPEAPPELVWRGLDLYLLDGWFEYKHHPSPDTKIRLALEVNTMFGNLDNTTRTPVGKQEDETASDINCFDEDARASNEDLCLVNSKEFFQLGVALESQFSLGGPIDFGLNGGFATGGDAANWGYNDQDGAELDFFRFDPDYHVDLILFRNVIGTVTNAYYFNPYIQATFLEAGDRKVRLDVDMILSRAANEAGTPAGDDGWLGFEIDGAARYIIQDKLEAVLQGGILFPLGALNAVEGRQSLTTFGTGTGVFSQDREAKPAWTAQLHLNWKF